MKDTNNNNPQNDIQDDANDDDDKMEEPTIQFYTLSNQPGPKYVQPLPDCLHIPIIDLMSSKPIGTIHLSPHIVSMIQYICLS